MKKKLSLLVLLAVCLALTAGILCACNQDKDESGVAFKSVTTVRFLVDGKEYYEINRGGVTEYIKDLSGKPVETAWPEAPVKNGYTFEGWYTNNSFSDQDIPYQYDFTEADCQEYLEKNSGKVLEVYARMKNTSEPEHLVRFFDDENYLVDIRLLSTGNVINNIPKVENRGSKDEVFVGWTTEPGDIGAAWRPRIDRVSDDVDLYPLYIQTDVAYSVTTVIDEKMEESGNGFYFETYDEYYPILSEFSAKSELLSAGGYDVNFEDFKVYRADSESSEDILVPVVAGGNGEPTISSFAADGVTEGYVLPLETGENRFTVELILGGTVKESLEVTIKRFAKEVSVIFDVNGDGSRYQIFSGAENELLSDYPKIERNGFLGWEIRTVDNQYYQGEFFDPETDTVSADMGVLKPVYDGDSRLVEKGSRVSVPEGENIEGLAVQNKTTALWNKDLQYANSEKFGLFILNKTKGKFEFTENWLLPEGTDMDDLYGAAQWLYEITYVTDGGYVANGYDYYDSGKMTTLPSGNRIVKVGYDFEGWYDDSGRVFTAIPKGSTGDITLTAKWGPKTYFIYYYLGGGGTNNKDNPRKYSYDVETVLYDPERTGYAFKGWYDDSGNAVTGIPAGSTGEITLTAKWEPYTYMITYELDKGTNSADNPDEYTVESGRIVLKDPVREGYTFKGWYDVWGDLVTEIPAGSTGNIRLTAEWEENEYYIVYIFGYENDGNPTTYHKDDSIKLKDPEREGYIFKGWYDNPLLQGDPVTRIGNGTGLIILYASWQKKPVSL